MTPWLMIGNVSVSGCKLKILGRENLKKRVCDFIMHINAVSEEVNPG